MGFWEGVGGFFKGVGQTVQNIAQNPYVQKTVFDLGSQYVQSKIYKDPKPGPYAVGPTMAELTNPNSPYYRGTWGTPPGAINGGWAPPTPQLQYPTYQQYPPQLQARAGRKMAEGVTTQPLSIGPGPAVRLDTGQTWQDWASEPLIDKGLSWAYDALFGGDTQVPNGNGFPTPGMTQPRELTNYRVLPQQLLGPATQAGAMQMFRMGGPTVRVSNMIEGVHPVTGKIHYWKHMGRPILFTGDLANVRRVGRVQARLNRCRPRKR